MDSPRDTRHSIWLRVKLRVHQEQPSTETLVLSTLKLQHHQAQSFLVQPLPRLSAISRLPTSSGTTLRGLEDEDSSVPSAFQIHDPSRTAPQGPVPTSAIPPSLRSSKSPTSKRIRSTWMSACEFAVSTRRFSALIYCRYSHRSSTSLISIQHSPCWSGSRTSDTELESRVGKHERVRVKETSCSTHLHTRARPSAPAVAKNLPELLTATRFTRASQESQSSRCSLPDVRCETCTWCKLSRMTEHSQSGELPEFLWPSRRSRTVPLFQSQRCTPQSFELLKTHGV